MVREKMGTREWRVKWKELDEFKEEEKENLAEEKEKKEGRGRGKRRSP